jgi:hypothetical protein
MCEGRAAISTAASWALVPAGSGPEADAVRADLDLPRVLSATRARELGLTRTAIAHAINRRGWQRLTPGFVLTVTGAPTRADWVRLGLLIAGPTAAVSGWDALRLISARIAPA